MNFKDVLVKLEARLGLLERATEHTSTATVTSLTPFMVRLAGPSLTEHPAVRMVDCAVGDRVVCLHRGRQLVAIAATPHPPVPFAMAAGVTTFSADTNGPVAFPPGRFTTSPIVSLATHNLALRPSFSGISSAGMTLHLRHIDGASSSSVVSVRWIAVQMTPTSAEG